MSYDLLQKLNLHNISKKQWWFGVFFLISGILFWLYLYIVFTSKGSFIALIVLGILWLFFAGFSALFLEKRLLFILYVFLSLLIITLFSFRGFNIVGILIFLAIIFWSHSKAKRVQNSLSLPKTFFVLRKFFPIFLTGFAIMLAFSWQSFIFGDLEEPPQISEQVFHVIFIPSDNIIAGMVPGYRTGMTIGEIQGILQEGFLSKLFRGAPQETENFFGFNVEPQNEAQRNLFNLSFEDFTRIWINTNIQNLINPYLGLTPFFIIVGLFLVLKFLLWYIKWLVLILLWFVVKVLMWYDVLTVREVQTAIKVQALE